MGIPHLVERGGIILDNAGCPDTAKGGTTTRQHLGVFYCTILTVNRFGITDDGTDTIQEVKDSGLPCRYIPTTQVTQYILEFCPAEVGLGARVPHLVGATILDDAGCSDTIPQLAAPGKGFAFHDCPGYTVGGGSIANDDTGSTQEIQKAVDIIGAQDCQVVEKGVNILVGYIIENIIKVAFL